MAEVCLYFHMHQPRRLRDYRIFDISNRHDYFDAQKNKQIFLKVASKCYIPATNILLQLLEKYPEFKVSFSITGTLLEQMEEHAPELLTLLTKMIATGRVEILGETYYHSLSSLYSHTDFEEQVKLHTQKITSLFHVHPTTFRNTELIYSNTIAKCVAELGFNAILAEGWDPILQWRSPNYVYQSLNLPLALLLKNYRLSDDIAFRFSNKSWNEWPLTPEKYHSWIQASKGEVVNLFMDYETFGEHQWEESGIFVFLQSFVQRHITQQGTFTLPRETRNSYPPKEQLDIKKPLSWADTERDISAWAGNPLQNAVLSKLYSLEAPVKKSGDKELLRDWYQLTTSDHFYYMCIKYFSDGDVHKYFSPYETPYEAFIAMMNILSDMEYRLRTPQEPKVFEQACLK